MFNAKSFKEAQVAPTEKYLRKEDKAKPADDDQPIAEKKLPDRKGDLEKVTEGQMKDDSVHSMKNEEGDKEKDAQLLEGILNEAGGKYIDHRNDSTWLKVPPVAAVVEKLRAERQKESKEAQEKDSHWTTKKPTQNADLPALAKNAPQHKKTVLENDPRRFTGVKNPVDSKSKTEVKPLVGDITTADLDKAVAIIKTGQTMDYDAAIVAILKNADAETRELTDIEQKTISDLKVARTKMALKT